MLKNSAIWILAMIITVASAVFQRKTGPTYPLSGRSSLGDLNLPYRFERTHAGSGDRTVSIVAPSADVTAELVWRRYKSGEEWTRQPMSRSGELLTAALPHQPPAGKLEYHVEVSRGDQFVLLPARENVVIRFRGDVPAWALVPHVALMFLAMLFATVVGLLSLNPNAPIMGKIWTTIILLFLGGFVFGPIVQKFAFSEYWTGFPFGTDLTDNKTLIALATWLITMVIIRRKPDSLHGSELDYTKIKQPAMTQ